MYVHIRLIVAKFHLSVEKVSAKIQQLLNTLKKPKRRPLPEFYEDDDIELEMAANNKDPNAPSPEGSSMTPAVGPQLVIPAGLPRNLEVEDLFHGLPLLSWIVSLVMDCLSCLTVEKASILYWLTDSMMTRLIIDDWLDVLFFIFSSFVPSTKLNGEEYLWRSALKGVLAIFSLKVLVYIFSENENDPQIFFFLTKKKFYRKLVYFASLIDKNSRLP